MSNYRYDRAPGRIGDDGHSYAIKRHMANLKLPALVRHWLKRIAAQIDKNWEKTTKEWPQP